VSREHDDKIQHLLKEVVDHFDKEDRAVRERQIRTWRRLKLYWEGFQRVWWNDVAHDWKIYDEQMIAESSSDQGYYDKPVNVFRALLETIIAALSVNIPNIVCYPDDADNPLDVATAKAGTKIAGLLAKHNDLSLLWLHCLYIWCTEGMVACYTYPKADDSFGTYEENNYEDESTEAYQCPNCGSQLNDDLFTQAEDFANTEKDEFDPDDSDVPLHDELAKGQIICPQCSIQLDPDLQKTTLVTTRLVGTTTKPKTRQCMEAYGGLYVKIPVYAMKQEDCPYLILAYEIHYSQVLKRYEHLAKEDFNLKTSAGGMYDPYERWGRLNPQYNGEYPLNTVTVRNCWLRPWAFNILPEEDAKFLKKEFPDGAKVVFANEIYAESENEALDDCWTIRQDPLSDYIHHDPLGMMLVNIQDITNEIISLVLQTIEHGISQTFADPAVVNFDQYRQQEATPGMIIPTKAPRTGMKIADGFFETRTANLSGEVLPFSEKIQEFGQFVSGALPSLFGGALDNSNTASEYSMSRAQALQRLQNIWKTLLVFWKNINGKAINSFIKELSTDERYVAKDEHGEFYNVFIRKSELLGKLGNIELEATENLPLTWGQRNGILMQFMQNANPMFMQMLMDPENINILKEAMGLEDMVVPGEDDRQKQYEEILQLTNSEPLQVPQPVMGPPGPNGEPPQPMMGPDGQPMIEPQEQPSVPIDPEIDNHAIQGQICRHWLVSDAGRLAKLENPVGYRNVMLHMKEHLMAMQPPPGSQPAPPPNMHQPQPQAAPQQQGAPQ
jgi:hypothetical protein